MAVPAGALNPALVEQLRSASQKLEAETVALVQELVRIPSENPKLALIEAGARVPELLIYVGDADPFIEKELRPELLERACVEAGIPLTLHRQPGYDHSYYFISTFMADHLAWHAERLLGG